MHVKSLPSCPTLWTVAYQAPLSTGILQARILKWVAMPSSRESSQRRNLTHISWVICISRWISLPLAPTTTLTKYYFLHFISWRNQRSSKSFVLSFLSSFKLSYPQPTPFEVFSILFLKKSISVYLFGCTGSKLWYVGSFIFIVACRVFSCGMWDLVPWPEMDLGSLAVEAWVLATGPPGKS